MLTISSSIEVYEKVFYEDDGMRTYDVTKAPYGWSILQGNHSSDGDIGSLSIDTGESTAEISKTLPTEYLTSNYSYIAFYCTSLTAGTIELEGYYNGISKGKVDETSSGHYEYYGTGNTIDELRFRIKGTAGEFAKIDYLVVSDNTMRNIFPSEIEINRVVTEGFDDALIKYDYAYPFPLQNSHIKIWLKKNGSYSKEFCGITKLNREIYDGKVPKWHETECSGYGKYLYDRIYSKGIVDTVHNVVNSITTSLRESGLLTTYNVPVSATQIKIRSEQQGRYIGDILEDDIANPGNKVDWDFYVDFGKDLHAYPKGTRTQSTNVGTHALTFNYEEDSEKLINTVRIRGPLGYNQGSDTDWTENTASWKSSYGDLIEDSTYKKVGTRSVMGKGDNTGIYLERTLSPALSLRGGGYLYAYVRYRAHFDSAPDVSEIDYSIYFKTTSSDYFVYSQKQGGGRIGRTGYNLRPIPTVITGSYYQYDWFQIKIPITKLFSPTDYTEAGTPDWNEIEVIGLGINSPLCDSGREAYLWIDDMSIDTCYYGIYGNDISINSFGIRELELRRPNLVDNEACTIGCSLIVEAYKDPLVNITDLSVSRNFDCSIGSRVNFQSGDLDTSVDLRRITQTIEDFELTTELELSNRYIPSVDKMMSVFQRQLDALNYNIEAWKDITGGAGINRSREDLIDWWNVDNELFPSFLWTDKKFVSVPFEYLDNYDWTDSGFESECKPRLRPPSYVILPSETTGRESEIAGTIGFIETSIGCAFRCKVKYVEHDTAGEAHVRLGGTWYGGGDYIEIRFFETSGSIRAEVYDGSYYQTWLCSYDPTKFYLIQADYIRSEGSVYFYVDGEIKGTLSAPDFDTSIHTFYINSHGGTLHIQNFQFVGD